MKASARRTMYAVCYKIDNPDATRWNTVEQSDRLDIDFQTSDAAIEHIREIRNDPERHGYLPWMGFAYLWVVDGDGNIIWS